ncbi:MAG TPA: DUF3667 domain-containing protein [Myxococcaceae bacterium]|nr:DUF3667 domain-containing protein [Myxococcaceae bacterium]
MLGPFCAACGQKNEPEHRSLWRLVKDGVGPAVLLESRLWRTVGTLLLQPGGLSEAYAEGKRTRFIRPLRLYFWVSVLFFSALALKPLHLVVIQVGREDTVHIPWAPQLEKRLQEKLEPLKDGPSGEHAGAQNGTSAKDRLRLEFLSRLPKAVFLLLPLFALLLRMLWWNRPYVEHLVFALHAHTVLFLALGLTLTGWLPFQVLGAVGPVLWFVLAVRRFYRSGWVGTVLKTVSLGVLDLFVSSMLAVGTMLIALLGT